MFKHSYQFLRGKNEISKKDIINEIYREMGKKSSEQMRDPGSWADSAAFETGTSNPFTNLGHGIVFVSHKNGDVSKVSVLLGHFNLLNHIQFSTANLSRYAKKFSTEFRKEINLCWVYNRHTSSIG